MAKKKRKASKRKIRFFFAFLIFSGITLVLGYNLFSNIMSINKMKVEKKELKEKIVSLKEEKKVLESDIKKLQDSDYIAKYVREKYFYSKDGELILRMDK
jgi:cell division protein DivIC